MKQKNFENEKFYLFFALAKIYQDNKDYSNSFKAYSEANNICKNLFKYNHLNELDKYKKYKIQLWFIKKSWVKISWKH